jgi:DNA topoisomerase I
LKKKSLLIVESLAKIRTMKTFLGPDFVFETSKGHIRDLPTKSLGVNIENDFEPKYEVLPGKKDSLDAIRKALRGTDKVYLAMDPGCEGEFIAWHIADELKNRKKEIYRVNIHEITPEGVSKVLSNPEKLNIDLFEAQQARRILDRLVAYKISPLLWSKVKSGISIGRVQSVAVRIICDREYEIQKFSEEEYWSIDVDVEAHDSLGFTMRLSKIDGEKARINDKMEACSVLSDIEEGSFSVTDVEKKDISKSPAPPFITSTLLEESCRILGFSVPQTMTIARQLYEGVPIGEEKHLSLVSYIKTGSTELSPVAVNAARQFIKDNFDDEYLSPEPEFYDNTRSARGYYAITPVNFKWTPDRIKPFIEESQYLLYNLIWNRFIASQMSSARFIQTRIDCHPMEEYTLSAVGLENVFPGFLVMYGEYKGKNGNSTILSSLKKGDELTLLDLKSSQNLTRIPSRYTESDLIHELYRYGIGRPFSYASIINSMQDKGYVIKENGEFYSTDLGNVVTKILVKTFPEIMNIKFSSMMEDQLDRVEQGKVKWVDLLKNFYNQFEKRLSEAPKQMRNVRGETKTTEVHCEKCGAKMVIRWGKRGHFLACPNYPECRNTKEFEMDTEGNIKIKEQKITEIKCEKCGLSMIVRTGKRGKFLACSGYPDCRNTKPFPIGVKCPDCEGELVERMSQKGRVFYSCSNYPECKFVLREKPLRTPCPECGASFLMLEWRNGKRQAKCPKIDCSYRKDA